MNSRLTVTILGSGTCVPSLTRSACSLLMETDAVKALFDCGPGTMRRLLEAGVTIADVTHLFLSHFHPDHTGELVSLLFAGKYSPGMRRTGPLVIAGGTGLTGFYAALKAVYGEWIDLDGRLEFRELSTAGEDHYQDGAFGVTTRPMAHRPESIGFRVIVNGVSVVYSGDTDVTDQLVELSRGADLLICEAALPDGMKAEGHLTPSLAGETARRAGVGRLALTHFYPACELVDIKEQCAGKFSGDIIVARDLMRIEL